MLQQIESFAVQWGMSQQSLAILGIGLGAMLAIYGLAGAFAPRDAVLRRLAAQAPHARSNPVEAGLLRPASIDPKGLMKSLIPTDRNARSQVQRRLAEAGMRGPHAVRNFYLARAILGLVLPLALIGTIALLRVGDITLPGGLGAALVGMSSTALLEVLTLLVGLGFFGPAWWIRSRAAARRDAIRLAFPNVLDLLQISVESGLGLDAAMIRVANETQKIAPAISEEFLILQREIQAGRPRDRAFADMAERTGVEEVASFVGAVQQSLQFGASISDALMTYAEEMRTTRELKAQEMANKLPVKLSGVMAAMMLPALIILAIGPVAIRFLRYLGGL